jgi:ectoine hydroxylase-related dioxygenase (phytanoyl-CoA dioxygenase family)
MLVTPAQIQQYRDEGYFILESVIPPAVVAGLQAECQRYIDRFDAQMEEKGVQTDGINHYKKRYFISNRGQESAVITGFIFSHLMADICRATLGDTAYLFNEQYVVKAAEVGLKFGWHQDSGYVGHYHEPYLSCWCALDDMTEANGTVYVLPYDRAGTRDLVTHQVEEGTNDKVGYYGDDPGIPAIVPVGSIVVFSSRTFHRSGTNTTDRMRRSYLVQYSAEPIMNKDGTKVQNRAVPFLQNGRRLAPPVTT